ncbi:hypothetical protein SAMN05444422_102398 [Halobiforma haloterrestris]|uniref:Uncharacterized protein n=1 Tax=Natronobacterium haloterrestre TaxID=148448 RepID=A0A1I1EK57_NATHA|nr:hypothetical protein [Halobiforma haloterrestris]SFB85283.1 hypothetical protein SAMN05444422_102398 [Halobiforma haloterrestris]
MVRFRRLLAVLAVVGWTGTALSQLVALRADTQRERIEWTERRNRFLLLSSLSTNALTVATLYRYARAVRRRGDSTVR